MTPILHTTFYYFFSGIKFVACLFKCHWYLFPNVSINSLASDKFEWNLNNQLNLVIDG